MEPVNGMTRRAVIGVGGACFVGAGTALALAGCGVHPPSPAKVPGELARLADIPVGGAASVMVDGKQILISQPEQGTVAAFSAVCPHQGCMVRPHGEGFECPCHNAAFDLATGEVLRGPATSALTPIAVAVSGNAVVAA